MSDFTHKLAASADALAAIDFEDISDRLIRAALRIDRLEEQIERFQAACPHVSVAPRTFPPNPEIVSICLCCEKRFPRA
jgi:hypothetical protein